MKKAEKKKARGKARERQKSGEFVEERNRAKSVYAGFARWKSRARPKWHPVRKLRYVFSRMIAGATVSDALREIRWPASEFWHTLDLKSDPKGETPFRAEYMRAKTLQGRAVADSVIWIAEGRDPATRAAAKKVRREIRTAMRRAGRAKSRAQVRAIVAQMMSSIDVNDLRAISRNKLQIEAAKWLAKAVNPAEFGEKTQFGIGGAARNYDGGGGIGGAVVVTFVAPDGSEVPFEPATGGGSE